MKIVLAYSGGLDTSVLLSWIKEKYSAEGSPDVLMSDKKKKQKV